MSPDEAMRVRDADIRREYALSHPVLVCITTFAFLGSAATLIVPSAVGESSIGLILVPGLRWLWSLLYLTGSSMVLYSLWIRVTHPHRSSRLEATGLTLLASCYTVYCVAIFANRGFKPGLLASSVFIGLSIGCIVRAFLVATNREAPWRRRST